MSDGSQNANQRRLEQLRAMRGEALPEPTAEEEIAELRARVRELEAEVVRLRELLQATRPRPETQSADSQAPIRPV